MNQKNICQFCKNYKPDRDNFYSCDKVYLEGGRDGYSPTKYAKCKYYKYLKDLFDPIENFENRMEEAHANYIKLNKEKMILEDRISKLEDKLLKCN